MKIPIKVRKICEKIEAAGYPVYVVGGCVRDFYLGQEPGDYDLVTKARPKELFNLFNLTEKSQVGKNFGVVLVDGIDVATFRKDKYVSEVGKNRDKIIVEYADTIEEDLNRRDLSINAMAINPSHYRKRSNDGLIDLHNGLEDLKAGRIKFIGDPKVRILEDPVRILRAARFYAMLKSKNPNAFIHPQSLIAMSDMVNELGYVPRERIQLEIMKAMKYQEASYFWEIFNSCGYLRVILPELSLSFRHDHGKYHTENIWDHVMKCGDILPCNKPLLKLVGYLHDYGKPTAYNPEDGSFIEHEKIGAWMLKPILERLRFSYEEVKYITDMTILHMRMIHNLSPKTMRRLLVICVAKEIDYKDVIELHIADRHSNEGKQRLTEEEIESCYNSFINCQTEEAAFKIKDLTVDGKDVMEVLDIKPGTEVGRVLKALFEKVIDNPELNKREVLLSMIKEEL